MPGKNFSGGGSFYRQGGKLQRAHQRNGSSGSDNSNGTMNGGGSSSNTFYRNNKENLAVREAHKHKVKLDSYLAEDENFPSFKVQLAQMGLELRDIPADGNCLFRALGDQLEGHSRNHYRHRSSVANFMRENKSDFEPFVEDDMTFDNHLSNIQRLGTHAGNDAIVAFARLHASIVVIHQLNGKPLMIQGPSSASNLTRQFHIAYHNGDHYSSVRRQGDNTESPAHIRIEDALSMEGAAAAGGSGASKFSHSAHGKNFSSYQNQNQQNGGYHRNGMGMVSAKRGLKDIEHEVVLATNCSDVERVRESLMECDYDVDLAIADILQQLELSGDGEDDSASLASQHNSSDSGICPNSPTLSSNTVTSNGDDATNNNNNNDSNTNGDKTPTSVLKNRNGSSSSSGKGHKVHFRDDSYGGSSGYGSMSSNKGAKPKMMSDRKTKEMKKQEKKKRAEEAKRQKHLKTVQGNSNNNSNHNGAPHHPEVRDVTVVAFQDGKMTKI